MKHFYINIEWLEKQIENIKDFFEEITENDLKDLYCYRAFWMSYENVKIELEYMKKSWKKFIPWDGCENIKPDWSCWC